VKVRLLGICLALAVVSAAGAAPGLHFGFRAPTHAPKVNAKWFYTVRATLNGKAVHATVTAQIVDPVGGVHSVQFANSKRNVTNRAFVGVFRDFILFPPEARGIRLTLRVTVRTKRAKAVFPYWVQPR